MIRRNQRFLTQLYIVADFAVIQLSFLIAWFFKFESEWITYKEPLPIQVYGGWSLIYGLIAVVLGMLFSLYSPKRKNGLQTTYSASPRFISLACSCC